MHVLHSFGSHHGSPLADNFHRFKHSGKPHTGSLQAAPKHPGFSKQDGMQVLHASLNRQFQQVSTYSVSPVAKQEDIRLTAETVANNILGFIEQRLRKDQADGATAEQLAERLEQGLAGFKKGFAEAKEKIEALGFLSAEVEEDINKTYDLVVDGVEDLRERFVNGNDPTTDEDDNGVDQYSDVQKLTDAAALSASYGQVSYGQVNSFKFEVETADGDVVTIQAKSKDMYHAEYRAGSFNNGYSAGAFEQFSSFSSQSSRFHLQVNGELDEGELQALDQLLAKVEDLSADFFAGDLDSAMQQALNLGYNTEEIVGYSLNLHQVEVQKVAVAYQEVTPAATSINPLADRLQPLGDFARELLDAVNVGSVFNDPVSLIGDLSEQVDQNQGADSNTANHSDRFSNFMKSLLDSLPSKF